MLGCLMVNNKEIANSCSECGNCAKFPKSMNIGKMIQFDCKALISKRSMYIHRRTLRLSKDKFYSKRHEQCPLKEVTNIKEKTKETIIWDILKFNKDGKDIAMLTTKEAGLFELDTFEVWDKDKAVLTFKYKETTHNSQHTTRVFIKDSTND